MKFIIIKLIYEIIQIYYIYINFNSKNLDICKNKYKFLYFYF